LINIYIYMSISDAAIHNTHIYIYITSTSSYITTCVHKTIETRPQVHKSTNCLKSNETSSQHDQLSPRAYGECLCGGKMGRATGRLSHHLEPGDSNLPRKTAQRRQDCKC
jgi:hypothetical protein